MLADAGLVAAHATLADLLFLVAAILAGVVAVVRATNGALDGALIAGALACLAVGLLVL